MKRDFLSVDSLSTAELLRLLDHADGLKAERRSGAPPRDDLAGLSIGMIFEKPSTRTRVSFEVGITELGAHAVTLSAAELQLGRGETVEDTGRVLSRYLHGLVVRTFAQARLDALATGGTVPVVNALSDEAHPCQALADLQTIREHRGRLDGLTLAYLGDGNNVAHSLLRAGAMTGMRVAIGHPEGHAPLDRIVAQARGMAAETGGGIVITTDPLEAVDGADIVYTDVWASMGQEAQAQERAARFEPFRVDRRLLDAASRDALVMHCLPAHRGEEIAADVIDGPQSVVWDQAENRLHAQKALLLLLLAR